MARTNKAFQEFMAQEYPDFNEKYRQFLQVEMNKAFAAADFKKISRLADSLRAHLAIISDQNSKGSIE